MKHFIFLILILASFNLAAQKPKVKNDPTHDDRLLHFGFSLGLNTMDYNIRQSKYARDHSIFVDVANLDPGFHVHAISNLRLAEYWDLRFLPGISFGDRLLEFTDSSGAIMTPDNKPYKIEASYLEFPLLIKYKSKRLNNFRPYLIGGANVRVDLASKKQYDPIDQLIMIKPVDYYYEIGMGVDFYLTYFKFSIEVKYSAGLRNIFSTTNRKGEPPPGDIAVFTKAIDRITSSLVMISFHFE